MISYDQIQCINIQLKLSVPKIDENSKASPVLPSIKPNLIHNFNIIIPSIFSFCLSIVLSFSSVFNFFKYSMSVTADKDVTSERENEG